MIARHPQANLIVLVSWLIVFVWGCMVGLLLSMTCGILKCSEIAEPAFFISLFALVGSGAITLSLGIPVKCPNCGEKMLRQKQNEKHPDAIRFTGLDYWSSAILNCLFNKRIICMYCGSMYTCKQ